jgi:hypothetical protein
LLVKIKTTRVPKSDNNGVWRYEKYADFIAIQITGSVEEAVKTLPQNILVHMKSLTSVVTRHLEEQLYCRGIHKTLIDYVTERSLSNSEQRVIFKTWGKNNRGIIFEGIAVYILIASLSNSSKYEGLCLNGKKSEKMESLYNTIKGAVGVTRDSGIYEELGSCISNIKKRIKGAINLQNKDRYIPTKRENGATGDYYNLQISLELMYVRTVDSDIKLREWLESKGLWHEIMK